MVYKKEINEIQARKLYISGLSIIKEHYRSELVRMVATVVTNTDSSSS